MVAAHILARAGRMPPLPRRFNVAVMASSTSGATQRQRVLIAGGGVAAREALLALESLAGDSVQVELLSPEPEFHDRPLAVAEPFALGEVTSLALDELAAAHGATSSAVPSPPSSPGAKEIRTAEGHVVPYDARLLACGARAREALPGALTSPVAKRRTDCAPCSAASPRRSTGSSPPTATAGCRERMTSTRLET